LLARGLALAADTLVRKGAAHSSSALMHRSFCLATAIVSQKLALRGLAVIAVVGRTAIKLAYIEQYHGLARGHLTVRRLECVYGAEPVRAEYDELKAAELSQPVQIAACPRACAENHGSGLSSQHLISKIINWQKSRCVGRHGSPGSRDHRPGVRMARMALS
jgi:hypothetical protein